MRALKPSWGFLRQGLVCGFCDHRYSHDHPTHVYKPQLYIPSCCGSRSLFC